MKKYWRIVILSLISASLVLGNRYVEAASSGSIAVNTLSPTLSLPTNGGVDLYTPMEGVFTKVSGLDSQVLYSPNDQLDSAIMITADKGNQKGAIWSNPEYRLDLSKPFTSSMWLNISTKTTPADGMAFVMHNASAGSSAFMDQKNYGGSRLGVWGFDQNVTSTADAAKGAIPNSLAIELDTYSNGDTLDKNTPGVPHVAWNYPSNPASYILLPQNKVALVHNDAVSLSMGNVAEGKWHHFSLSWQPSNGSKSGNLTYTFNDRVAADDSVKSMTTDVVKKTIFIDDYVKRFGLTGSNSKVYWGFTGSTGGSSARNVMTFENIPGLVSANITESVVDVTRGVDITKSGVTYSGNQVNYTTSIKYDGANSKFDWRQLLLTQTKNSNLNLTGSEATVQYYLNGTKVGNDKKVSIDTKGNQLSLNLKDSGDLVKNAPIFDEIRVITPLTVGVVSSDVSVQENSTVDGNTAKGVTIVEDDKPVYTIKNSSKPIIGVTSKDLKPIFPGEELKFPATLQDDNSTTLTLNYELKNSAKELMKSGQYINDSSDYNLSDVRKGITVEEALTKDVTKKLSPGVYSITLTAKNGKNYADEVVLTFTILEDKLALVTVPDLNFSNKEATVAQIAKGNDLLPLPLTTNQPKVIIERTNPKRSWQLNLAMDNFHLVKDSNGNAIKPLESYQLATNIPIVLKIKMNTTEDARFLLNQSYMKDVYIPPAALKLANAEKSILIADSDQTATGKIEYTVSPDTTLYLGEGELIRAGTYRGDLIWTLSDVAQ